MFFHGPSRNRCCFCAPPPHMVFMSRACILCLPTSIPPSCWEGDLHTTPFSRAARLLPFPCRQEETLHWDWGRRRMCGCWLSYSLLPACMHILSWDFHWAEKNSTAHHIYSVREEGASRYLLLGFETGQTWAKHIFFTTALTLHTSCAPNLYSVPSLFTTSPKLALENLKFWRRQRHERGREHWNNIILPPPHKHCAPHCLCLLTLLFLGFCLSPVPTDLLTTHAGLFWRWLFGETKHFNI